MTTIYLDDHHKVFFQVVDELSKSGTVRTALDDYIDERRDIDIKEFKAAVQELNQENELENAIEQAEELSEVVEIAEEPDSSNTTDTVTSEQ